jgi:hypothetical protein
MHDKQHAVPSRAGGTDKHRFGIHAGPTTENLKYLLLIQVGASSAVSNQQLALECDAIYISSSRPQAACVMHVCAACMLILYGFSFVVPLLCSL